MTLNGSVQQRISEIMAERQLTVGDVANRMNRHPSQVSRWLRDGAGMKVDSIALFAAALDCTPMDLVG